MVQVDVSHVNPVRKAALDAAIEFIPYEHIAGSMQHKVTTIIEVAEDFEDYLRGEET